MNHLTLKMTPGELAALRTLVRLSLFAKFLDLHSKASSMPDGEFATKAMALGDDYRTVDESMGLAAEHDRAQPTARLTSQMLGIYLNLATTFQESVKTLYKRGFEVQCRQEDFDTLREKLLGLASGSAAEAQASANMPASAGLN
jgi:hypothetical protein